jgi:2-polyprenyl-6-methoxyphenol hydroxylase-like FAD-dependent oxidoreductase
MTSEPLTMAVLIDIREQLMGLWDEALTTARSTGHWDDVNACGVIIDAFHKTFADALRAVAAREEAASREADRLAAIRTDYDAKLAKLATSCQSAPALSASSRRK